MFNSFLLSSAQNSKFSSFPQGLVWTCPGLCVSDLISYCSPLYLLYNLAILALFPSKQPSIERQICRCTYKGHYLECFFETFAWQVIALLSIWGGLSWTFKVQIPFYLIIFISFTAFTTVYNLFTSSFAYFLLHN